jgi:type IV pilus assembly protein PilC
MFFEPQLSNKSLAELCHRLATETDAGIDIRRTWQREADITRGAARPYIASVRDAVARGDALSDAFAETGTLFPPIFLEMARVGEQTGTLGRVFHRLENHFRRQTQAQSIFLSAIAWPMLELGFAIFVIGALIWVMGMIGRRTGQKVDILGFGLVGNSGLAIYILFLIAIGGAITAFIVAMKRGKLWTRPVQHTLMTLPGIGGALQKICLARISWALHLLMNVEMDLRRVVPLVLRSTGIDFYTRHADQIVGDVAAGNPIHIAFSRSNAFPAEFIDALAVAEESGRMVESMDRLSNRYEEEATEAIKLIAKGMGFAITLLVMGIIVYMIFHLAGIYFGAINDAVNMKP